MNTEIEEIKNIRAKHKELIKKHTSELEGFSKMYGHLLNADHLIEDIGENKEVRSDQFNSIHIEPEEDELAETEEEPSSRHGFLLEVNDGKYFDNDFVLQCGLPEFAVSKKMGSTFFEGPVSVVVVMYHGPNVTSNLISAAKEASLDFKIHLTFEGEVYSTWKLCGAHIGGMQFGQMAKPPLEKPEEDFIKCEIIFNSVEVDGESV